MAGDWPQNSLKTSGPVPSGLDTSVPHIARVYDYWLGGKDNFAGEREAAEQVMAAYPGILRGVRAQRAFLANAVRHRAGVGGRRRVAGRRHRHPRAETIPPSPARDATR